MGPERDGTAFSPDEIFGELTPRKQEVAWLISQGLTNQEIAQQLTLTQVALPITSLTSSPRLAHALECRSR